MIVPCSRALRVRHRADSPESVITRCFIRLVRGMDANNGGMGGAWLMWYGVVCCWFARIDPRGPMQT